MDQESKRNELISLLQDYIILHEHLAVSLFRRILANLIDLSAAAGLALVLALNGFNPWMALAYLLLRDLPPLGRGLGKRLCGIRICNSADLCPPTALQLVTRGLENFVIILPCCMLALPACIYVFGGLVASRDFPSGRLKYLGYLEWAGYESKSGRLLADRAAGTRLISSRDLAAIWQMDSEIKKLEAVIVREDPELT